MQVAEIVAISQELKQMIIDSQGKCFACNVNLKVDNDVAERERHLASEAWDLTQLTDCIVSR